MGKILIVSMGLAMASFAAAPIEIAVRLKMDQDVYILGERIRAVADITNSSGDDLAYNMTNFLGEVVSRDMFRVELYRASDRFAYTHLKDKPFVAPFLIKSSEGQRFEMFLGEHFAFTEGTRYLARAVLIHDGMRFESSLKGFDVVPGMKATAALQMFSNRPKLRREFEAVHWGRNRMEHLFLKARDTGSSTWRWDTIDLGPYMAVTPPKISIMPNGEVIVLHRTSQDGFLRNLFWSLPDILEFQNRTRLVDPEVAGMERSKDAYADAHKRAPDKKKKSWWQFWGSSDSKDEASSAQDGEAKAK